MVIVLFTLQNSQKDHRKTLNNKVKKVKSDTHPPKKFVLFASMKAL